MQKRERNVERKLADRVREFGGIAYKFTSPGNAGVPDRIVLLPYGIIYFVELKTEIGRLSPVQIAQQDRIRSLGCRVETVYGMGDVERLACEMSRRIEAARAEMINRSLERRMP